MKNIGSPKEKIQPVQPEKHFSIQVKLALVRLHDYLRKFTQQLAYSPLDMLINYQIKGCGKLDDFRQENYGLIAHDDIKTYRSISDDSLKNDTRSNFFLRFTCKTPYLVRLQKHSKHEIALQKDFFTKNNISFTCSSVSDANGKFIQAVISVEPVIHVEFEFVGNFETNMIDFTVTNFTELGKKNYILQPEKIDDTFLDELAKYLTRQANNLILQEKIL